MKFDKETLMKEHFWFLLILVLPLVLVSLVLLLATSSDLIAAPEKKIKDTKTKLESISPTAQPKNPKWVEALNKVEGLVDGQKTKIWEQAWKEQERLATWPATFSKPMQDELGKMYFGDEISSPIRSNYNNNFSPTSKLTHYENQILDIVDIAQPKNELDQITVQFGGKGNRWQDVLRWISQWATSKPTSEEMWLAQEDLWVQRGLLQIVRDTNDAAARFQGKGEGKHKVFSNADWVLDLTLAEAQGKPLIKTKLTNVSGRRGSLGFTFKVGFTDSSLVEMLPVDGEPLAPGKSVAFDWPVKKAGRPKELGEVVQIFDWRTAPVKRIDLIDLGALSNRQASLELKVAKVFDKTDPNAPPPAPAPGAEGRTEGPGGTPAAAGANDRTENQLVRKRYIDTTDQVRRMPVGIVLIVDQAHVQDVLTATANSPLRIQTTQWHWRRFHGDIKPLEEQRTSFTSPEGGSLPVAVEGALSRPPSSERPPLLNRPGGSFSPLSPPGSMAQADEQEWDLVELSIYGIASLYERFPPPSAKPADAAAPGASPMK